MAELGTSELKIQMVGATDKGLVRERNEDCIKLIPEYGIAILADGMGGHLAGDVASSMAVEVIAEELLKEIEVGVQSPVFTQEKLVRSLSKANKSIRLVAKSKPECHGMGATVAVCVVSDQVLVSHLGDSRVYQFADGELSLLTEDHTLAQEYLKQGMLNEDEARTWAGRNLLMKGLGIESTVDPDIKIGPVKKNYLYLLCSDGLTDVVSDERISQTLGAATENLEDTVNRLIELAIDNGGPDNISVILIRALTQN
ncbi:MAG: protein phosphatase 2C domain-containing protein [Arenicellales bacterium]|nr:protein phosphatase 2C domain-containing protein [Arenicellales bacterium]